MTLGTTGDIYFRRIQTGSLKLPLTKTVGAYEAKTHWPALIDLVAKGREVVITKHERPVARLVPAGQPIARKQVFDRIRALHARLSLRKGATAHDLIEAGRRI